MCIRCKTMEAPQPLGYCPVCALNVRIELATGFRHLAEYLGAWAAFEEWLRGRSLEQPGPAD